MPIHAKLFTCEKCNFSCSKHSNWDKHTMTAKHINRTNRTPKNAEKYRCDCGKEYKARNSLWYHKQNQEFKEMMIEQHNTIVELSKNTGNTITNNNTINNTTNNKFNLNVFLNETCKDAINLNDFIQSIELTIRDFVKTGELGYVRGISDIMLERIRDMHPHIRPIHCTDLKRETVYVKDSDVWSKEDETKSHLRKAVKIVANKNKNQVHSWIQENPQYDVLDTPECDKFFEYSKVSLGGYGKDEGDRYDNKIISNVLKEVILDKGNIRM